MRPTLVKLATASIGNQGSTAYVVSLGRRGLRSHRSDGRQGLVSHSDRHHPREQRRQMQTPLFSEPYDDVVNFDPNRWISSDSESSLGDASWEETLQRREDGSLWSSFSSPDDATSEMISDDAKSTADTDGGEEAWLDALASIAADEVAFMSKEADRADKVRQMQEMGFGAESISSTLGVATDAELETDDTNVIFEAFKAETAKTGFGLMVDDDADLQVVESHTRVEWDDESNEPVRAQHVYVDEVTCIGCTNCAMIAQSTFFMEGEHGRARVFQQWGGETKRTSSEFASKRISSCNSDLPTSHQLPTSLFGIDVNYS
jgi:ferredoxin